MQRTLESKFDVLGPVEFSKRVSRFAWWLGEHGTHLNPEDRLRALAEYAFLQSRLEFWLGYKYIPPRAHGNLISASALLYPAATSSGLVHPGEQPMPRSFLAAAMASMAFSGGGDAPIGVGGSRRFASEFESFEPIPGRPRLGGVAHNQDIGVVWNGAEKQGLSFEDAYERMNPDALRMPKGSKAFDFYWDRLQKAVSVKTLNIVSPTYIRNPQKISGVIKGYIDEAADYNKPRAGYELLPGMIRYREIQLAIPEGASPEQIRYLTRAWNYARSRDVNLEITSIRE